jgi:hypothetical protein
MLVGDLRGDRPSGKLGDQLRAPRRCHGDGVGIHLAFEPRRCFRAQQVPPAGVRDRSVIEVSGLEDDRRRVGGDLRVPASHHAGDRQCLRGVGDHEVGRIQLALDPVQGRESLSVLRSANHDVAICHAGGVERVQGMPELEQDVVGRVDDVGDGTHPRCQEPARDVGRGGTDLHPVDVTRQVARTPLGILDLHLHPGIDLVRGSGLDLRHPEFLAEQGGDLTSQAHDAHEIRPVRRDLELEDRVVESQHLDDVVPERGIRWQHQDPGVVLRNSELSGGAQHPGTDLAADLALGDLHLREMGSDHGQGHVVPHREVLGATHHTLGFAVTALDVHEREVVGVGVIDYLEDLGDDHAGDAPPGRDDLLDLGSRETELLREVFDGNVQVDVVA